MGKLAVKIEEATAEDVGEVLAMIRGLAEYERLADHVVATEETLRESLFGPNPAAEVVFAKVGSETVGFALYFHNYSTFLGRKGLYLEDLFVKPEHRGRGHGRALLAHLASLAVERGCGRLEWSVLDWNAPAISFYRSLGAVALDDWTVFRVTGEKLRELAEQGLTAVADRIGPASGPRGVGTMRDREAQLGAAQRAVDALFAAVLRAGEDAVALREVVRNASPDDAVLVALLRRAVPVRLLELLAAETPWCDRPLVLGAVVRNPRVPRALGLKLLQFLFWHDLAEVAANPWTQGGVRVRAEALLKDMTEEMRLGDKIALARIATPSVIAPLLKLTDPKILDAALLNPRLHEEDLLQQIRSETVTTALLESVAATSRWGGQYAVRLGLVLQPRTPLALALAQVSGLARRDLLRVAETPGLKPLLQAAALRVVAGE